MPKPWEASENINAWDRMPPHEGDDGHMRIESSKAYAAFCIYRKMPPLQRSIRAAYQEMYGDTTSGLRQWEGWSSKYYWVERVGLWDQHLEHKAQQAQIKAVEEMLKRHAAEARALQSKALEALKDTPADALTTSMILRYFIEAAKLERISLGEPDSRSDITTKGEQVQGPVIYIPDNNREG